MDIVFISDLRIDTLIGIYDWERRVRQTISLDLEMGADIRKAADDVKKAEAAIIAMHPTKKVKPT